MENILLMAGIAGVLMIVGAFGGFLSGLLGIGGGLIFVPALYFLLQLLEWGGAYTMHVVVASSLAIISATVSMSAWGHYKKKSVDIDVLKLWAPFIVMGVLAGSFFASSVDGDVLKSIFAIVTLCMAFYMMFGRNRLETADIDYISKTWQRVICTAIGAVSSMVGMGGAAFTVPLMTVLGKPMHKCAGTGAAIGLLVSVPAVMGYFAMGLNVEGDLPPFSLGYVNMAIVIFTALPSMLMAPVGVRASHHLDQKILKRIFAVVLILVSIKMFMSL